MPPEDSPLGEARVWLRRAQGNLARARQPKPAEAFWEDLCFDAQQAAEKALKAVLILKGQDFPKTHNVGTLVSLLEGAGETVPDELRKASRLTNYATVCRYPGDAEPVTEDQFREAVTLAEAVVRWAEDRLRSTTE